MAKMKSGFTPTRSNDEIREIKVTLDFTPNALASVLYQQGDTMVLAFGQSRIAKHTEIKERGIHQILKGICTIPSYIYAFIPPLLS